MSTTTIIGFHQDAAGDWVAELGCGHSQHVRHRPPWQVRPWVVSDEGRAARVGTEIVCPLCPAPGTPAS
jgi:tellurite methyltransferase